MTIAPGTKLGPYEILTRIGAGGMGEVWKARDTRLGCVVVIKKVKEQHSERFKQEARSIAALNHPFICQLFDIGPDYLAEEMDKAGEWWEKVIKQRNPIAPNYGSVVFRSTSQWPVLARLMNLPEEAR